MLTRQLKARGIQDPLVLSAMLEVPREAFVPKAYQSEAYEDWPLPIGFGQTISQPFTVAFMIQTLNLKGGERVLEIGTGSGYGAAVLSRIAGRVDSLERIPQLAERARKTLDELGYQNVHVHQADGTLGLPSRAPFDGIVVTAGGKEFPRDLACQLADGGRMIVPIGKQPRSQVLYRFTRNGQTVRRESLGRFAFVPLIGEHGWQEEAAD